MSVAYIIKPGVKVHLEKNHLLIKGKDYTESLFTLNLERLVLVGKVEITNAALKHLFKNKTTIVFLSRRGQYLGSFIGPDGKNTLLRVKQYKRFIDSEFRLKTARNIVRGKITNMRTLVMRLARVKKSPTADRSVDSLNKILYLVEQAKDLASLRGFEGQASREYFRAYREVFSPNLKFKKRVRRPPTDPVNACLSFGYAVLHGVVLGAVQASGLDSGLGNLHELEYGRSSLALDLMEEFRPLIVDMTVLACFNLRILNKSYFNFESPNNKEIESEALVETIDPLNSEYCFQPQESVEENEESEPSTVTKVLLNYEGKRKFLTRLENRLEKVLYYPLKDKRYSLREIVYKQVEHYASYIKGEYKEYIPFVVK